MESRGGSTIVGSATIPSYCDYKYCACSISTIVRKE